MTGESQREPTSGAPDPTVLTTEQMLRAIVNLEKQMVGSVGGEVALINERIDSIRREMALTEKHRLELKSDGEKALTAAMTSADRARERERQVTETLLGKQGDEIDKLNAWRNQMSGRGAGVNSVWVMVFAAIAALGTLISVFVVFQS